MKKFIIATLAASILAGPVLAAPPQQGHYDRGRHEQVRGHDRNDRGPQVRHDNRRPPVQYRSWKKGQRFESRYARDYRVIAAPRSYRLQNAPRGYRWVQSGNDALLVGITSGIVASVIANIIR